MSLAAAGTAKASQKTAPQKNVGSRGSPSSSLQKLPSLSSALPATAGPSTTGAWKGSPNASTPATRSSAASSSVRTTSKTTKERTYGFLFVFFVVVVLLHPLQALRPSPFTPHSSPLLTPHPSPLTPHPSPLSPLPSPFALSSLLFALKDKGVMVQNLIVDGLRFFRIRSDKTVAGKNKKTISVSSGNSAKGSF